MYVGVDSTHRHSIHYTPIQGIDSEHLLPGKPRIQLEVRLPSQDKGFPLCKGLIHVSRRLGTMTP